ncbi:MAG: MFS transporter [Candidatus Vogelbacteria bacterium]|nr:MFS transporter [Candidatus Vogelbacteria bacterium]
MTKRPIFLAGFFLTFSAALSYYINSSFLAGLVGEKRVGLVYAAAAGLAIMALIAAAGLVRRFNFLWPSRILGLTLTAGYLGLALTARSLTLQLAFFLIVYTAIVTLSFWLDLQLESRSRDVETGRIRGGYLTVINAAILLAPFVSGATLAYSQNFRLIYGLGGLATLPLLYLLFWRFDEGSRPLPGPKLRQKLADGNLRRVLGLDFLLNLFYFVMVVYLPLYLNETLRFGWEKIGIIFTVMLLPFILIQYPLGWLADRRWGEKEMMTAGLAIAGLATVPIAYLTTPSAAVWAALLFLTRVGASAWEIMKESYLFKHVTAADRAVIGLSRLTVPLAYLVGSLASFLLLKIIHLPHLFTVLAICVLAGLFLNWRLKDTR